MKKAFPMGHKDKTVYMATVSGCASTKTDLIKYFNDNVPSVDFVTTKSFQVIQTSGNREPVICESKEGFFGNSVALRNPGLEAVLPELQRLKESSLRVHLNVSVSANNVDNFITLVKAFDSVADSIELNFSCPHASSGFGAAIGSSIETASMYVKKICEAYPERQSLLFVKLTPNVDNIDKIAKAVIDSGADGIAAINTVGPVIHIDPVCQKPILNNPIGGKGGVSGDFVFEKAIECISKIRQAVGDDVPIIGMGGVSDGQRAAKMVSSGADVIGIGTALAKVEQQNWENYFSCVKKEAQSILNNKEVKLNSRTFLKQGRIIAYEEYTVIEKTLHSSDTLLLTLDKNLNNFKAGEFVFLWLPGVGEKPFSVAKTEPLMFIIKKRGAFTEAIFDKLNVNDKIMLRGPYGKEAQTVKAKKAVVIAGGTGEAVALPLAQKLKDDNTPMRFLVGTSVDGNRGILEKELSAFGQYLCVSDSGKPGRILDYLEETLSQEDIANTAFYIIGPSIFMKIASSKLCSMGAKKDKILLSMEKNTMCGIGLCGECSCAGKLTCQWGTFMSYEFLDKENVL